MFSAMTDCEQQKMILLPVSYPDMKKAALSFDNTTVFRAPIPFRIPRMPSGSIFVGILAHAFGSDKLRRLPFSLPRLSQ